MTFFTATINYCMITFLLNFCFHSRKHESDIGAVWTMASKTGMVSFYCQLFLLPLTLRPVGLLFWFKCSKEAMTRDHRKPIEQVVLLWQAEWTDLLPCEKMRTIQDITKLRQYNIYLVQCLYYASGPLSVHFITRALLFPSLITLQIICWIKWMQPGTELLNII